MDLNTDPAKRSADQLGNYIKNASKDAQKIGIGSNLGGIDNSKLKDFAMMGRNDFDDLSDVLSKLNNNLDKIINTPPKPGGGGGKDNPNDDKDKGDKDKEGKKFLGGLTKAGFTIGAARGVQNYFKSGAASAASYEKSALDTYNRLGVYGKDFNKARSDATNLGKKYGYDTGQTIGLQDTILQGGFLGLGDLQESTKDLMETSLAFGVDANLLGSDYAKFRKRGFANVSAKDYTDTIGTNIAAGSMKGREDEVARSLADITDIITNGKLEVNSSDFEMAANLQAQLAKQNPALKGDKGAELIGKMQGGFNSSDMTTLRLFGYGNQLGYGIEGLYKAKKLAEEGLSNAEGVKIFNENLGPATGNDPFAKSIYLSQAMGTKITESDEILKLLESGTSDDYQKIKEKYGQGGDKQANIETAQSSKSFTNTQYELNKESAQLDAGNAQNSLTAPLKGAYNGLPGFMQGGISVAGAAIGGGLAGGLIGSIPKFLSGGFGKGASGAFKGLSKAGGFVGRNAGKIAGGLGIGLTALSYGTSAYDHFKKGEKQEGFETIGSGAGVIGGSLGGAKLGAMAGTAIMPGIGTALGGIVGGIAGGLAGEKLGGFIGKGLAPSTVEASELHKDRKDKDLVSRKELVIKREEQILDRLESGNLFNINIDNGKQKPKNKPTSTNNSTGSSFADERNQFAMDFANGEISSYESTGPLIGDGNSEKIWNYFKKKGFSDAGISGIMANLYHESGYNPSQKQLGGGPGRGLAQWEGPRFTALQEFARGRSQSWTDLQTQLDFLMHEMKTNHSSSFEEYFKNASDASIAAAKFENEFERPAVNHNAERGATAKQLLKESKAGKKAPSNPTQSNISSYAVGSDRIDSDQLAFLHKDEAVLNKFEAREYRESVENNNNGGTINLNVTIQGGDSTGLDDQIKRAIILAAKQLSGNGQEFKLNQAYKRQAR